MTQSLRGWDDAADVVRVSEDSGATWSAPRVVVPRGDPRRLSQPCSALAMDDGTLVLACDGDGHRTERLVTSRDGGATWRVAGGDLREAFGARAIHPAIVRRADGSILAFLRGPNPMPMLVTGDLGETWTKGVSTLPGINVGQKAAALRLSGGGILLVSHDKGVFAALSLDEGRTWAHVRKLERMRGYLSAAQGPDGMIHVVGSRMSAVSFSEAWLREGQPFTR